MDILEKYQNENQTTNNKQQTWVDIDIASFYDFSIRFWNEKRRYLI